MDLFLVKKFLNGGARRNYPINATTELWYDFVYEPARYRQWEWYVMGVGAIDGVVTKNSGNCQFTGDFLAGLAE